MIVLLSLLVAGHLVDNTGVLDMQLINFGQVGLVSLLSLLFMLTNGFLKVRDGLGCPLVLLRVARRVLSNLGRGLFDMHLQLRHANILAHLLSQMVLFAFSLVVLRYDELLVEALERNLHALDLNVTLSNLELLLLRFGLRNRQSLIQISGNRNGHPRLPAGALVGRDRLSGRGLLHLVCYKTDGNDVKDSEVFFSQINALKLF